MRRFTAWIREGITHPWPGIFLKALAVVAVFGALSHVSSIMGLLGGPWAAKPLQVQVADLLLLATNLVLAWGLWRRKFWAAIAWMAVVLLFQAVPILLFADAFAVGLRARIRLYSVLATDLVLLGIFFALLRLTGLRPAREARPVGEVAAQLEDGWREAISRGETEDEADRLAREHVVQGPRLGRRS